MKRFNQTLCEFLAKLNEERKNWDEYISLTLFVYRTKVNKNTQFTLFYLVYGRKVKLPFDNNIEMEIILNDRIKELTIDLIQTKRKVIKNIKRF